MYNFNNIDKKMYFKFNKALEKQNKEYLELLQSNEYRLGSFLVRAKKTISSGDTTKMKGFLRNLRWKNNIIKSNLIESNNDKSEFTPQDYFSDEKIAIYTCVFGNYDKLQEPCIRPDNIDYYIITDKQVPSKSFWKPIDWSGICPEYLNNVEKNRFFKMRSDLIFPKYKYSIYIDGNVKVISDLTPYTKLLGKYGIGLHYHNQRNCAYEELMAIGMAHKANNRDITRYREYLKNNNFPDNYGLLECNVIVRDHYNDISKTLMNQWWLEFYHNFKRDQVSLPYILYKNNIRVEDVAVLGKDVYDNLSFRINKHN